METGDKILITTDNWFLAPDGLQYRAVWGTVKSLSDSEQVLGIKTNRNSTNWYVEIGNMIVAGCQIHYVIKTDTFEQGTVKDYDTSTGEVVEQKLPFTRIFNADE